MNDAVTPLMLEDSRYESIEALQDFHKALLRATLLNALETGFYRKRWAGLDPGDLERIELVDLPTIDKEDIRVAGQAAQNRQGVICNDLLTSGTTGNPLVTVRSDREQKFIHDFFVRQHAHQPVTHYLRGLEFTNPYHGHLISIPGAVHYHKVSVYDAGSFDYGRRTLLRSHCDHRVDERCSILMGLERGLRAFTADTMAQYPDGFPATSLRLVVSYSQYLTQNWRRRLETTWRAPVIDRFGVSEVFGGASQCLACGWYHFEPFVIPEVVGGATGKLVREGMGLLALTALYPFQQAQPLVRYLTGDLVEVTREASCRPGQLAIKPLGRARYGVPETGTDHWLLTPASILEAVDDIPEIKRIPRFADVDQVADPYAIGHPKYRTRWSAGPCGVEVTIEVALSLQVSEARRDDILAGVLREVTRCNPRLQAALRDRTASVVVAACDDVSADLIAQAHSGGVWSPA